MKYDDSTELFDKVKAGKRLYLSRANLRMSQGELAKAIGTNQTTVSAMETGRLADPKIELFWRAAAVLGVSRMYLIGESDNVVGSSSRELTDHEAAVLSELRRMRDSDIENLLPVIMAYAK